MTSTDASPPATRVDPAYGAREEVEFFGKQERVFTCLHLPPRAARFGVVICSPVASEFEKNYRRESLLAWSLAARGVAVGRFHYRGAGHSDGATTALSFESMVEDAHAAVAHFRSRTVVDRVAFLGTRLSALVAATVARDHPGAPVALWEPVAGGDQYFRDVFRAGFVTGLKRGRTTPPSTEEVIARLRADDWVDILGFTIGRRLYESAVGRSLEGELGAEARPLLVVQLSPTLKVQRPIGDLARRLEERGFPVDVRVIDEVEAWWFGGERRGKAALTQATADWLVTRLQGDVGP